MNQFAQAINHCKQGSFAGAVRSDNANEFSLPHLQSGAASNSEAMAQDIGAVQVTISNFPGGF
ncbi:unnamed protein product, partial [marine sediment metagenome]